MRSKHVHGGVSVSEVVMYPILLKHNLFSLFPSVSGTRGSAMRWRGPRETGSLARGTKAAAGTPPPGLSTPRSLISSRTGWRRPLSTGEAERVKASVGAQHEARQSEKGNENRKKRRVNERLGKRNMIMFIRLSTWWSSFPTYIPNKGGM